MHSIDGERGAMSKQRHPAVMIEVAQEFPEQLRFVGKLLFPLCVALVAGLGRWAFLQVRPLHGKAAAFPCDLQRSEAHTSELQSLMRIPYAVFCLKKKKHHTHNPEPHKPHMNN